MNSFSIIFLIFSFSAFSDACCPFPAFSFSALTNVSKTDFKCSEFISVSCEIFVEEDSGYGQVGIVGNVTEGVSPYLLVKGTSKASISLVCDTSSNLWKAKNPSKGYDNVGCAMERGGVWIAY
ncbi:hypothetical protein GCK72_005931 [Caenorhabditis remanei]|uniref:C6 domain-containing protein n=1 Tax=Caenorhabditis remanei TaxID=31234 RepID=A0A6A5HGM6_CAERE|nr:hypothetical protein GCK72_005931 [Caenorhabditis remanei]KAF1765977.1 hypothetical protein GCK72_005931 [Caenorhabditis remanei]